MAFCKNCGNEIQDTDRFCQSCGTPVMRPAAQGGDPVRQGGGQPNQGQSSQSNQNYGGSSQQNYGGPSYQNYGSPSYQNTGGRQYQDYGRQPYQNYGRPGGGAYRGSRGITPVQQMLKEFGGSIPFLVFIALTVVSIVMTLVLSGAGAPAMLIGLAPTILTAIGMILVFVECKTNPGAPAGGGLKVYKAGKIVNLVFIAIVGGILIVVLLIFGLALSSNPAWLEGLLEGLSRMGVDVSYYLSTIYSIGVSAGAAVISVIMIVAAIIVGVVVFLLILQQVKLMKMAKIIRESLAAGRPAGVIPIYPAVILIIWAVLSAISLISSLSAASRYMSLIASNSATVTAILLLVINLAQTVFSAGLIIRLRRQMAEIR